MNCGNQKLTHLDLFSGIGGFSLGLEAAGFATIAFAEVDPDASLVLQAHWPQVPNLGDVTKLCRRAYDCEPPDEEGNCWCPRCDADFGDCACIGTDQFIDEHGWPLVITGGVPCQPASSLGQMRGAADERWLWPEALRVVRELRPRYAIFENPPSVLVLPDFHRVLGQIAALGYDLWWDVIPAAAVGAGHLRERVFFFLADPERPRLEGHPRHESGSRQGGGCRTQPLRPVAPADLRTRKLNHRRWYAESGIQPVVNGLPGRVVKAALRCTGNAVVPQIPQIIAEALIQ